MSQRRHAAAAVPARHPRRRRGPVRVVDVGRLRLQPDHGQAHRDLHRRAPGRVTRAERLDLLTARRARHPRRRRRLRRRVPRARRPAPSIDWRARGPAVPAVAGRSPARRCSSSPACCSRSASMEYALVTHDFALAYVAENNATVTPLLYSITGLWSALEGSILLWALLLTVVTAVFVVAATGSRHADPVVGWATRRAARDRRVLPRPDRRPRDAVRAARGGATPRRARGRTRCSRTTRSSRSTRRSSTRDSSCSPCPSRSSSARWPPAGSARRGRPRRGAGRSSRGRRSPSGVVLGAWWSYQVLGWGGFWGWDPVENAALLPWLVGHGLRALGRRRGAARAASGSGTVTLAIAVVRPHDPRDLLHALGRLRERARVQLVDARADPARLLRARRRCGRSGCSRGAATGCARRSAIDEPISREGAFVANNVLFVGFAVGRAARHRLPARLPGDPARDGDGRTPVLRHGRGARRRCACCS